MGPQYIRVQKAAELALAGATVVTANTRAARTLRAETERRAWQAHTVCETPDILPLEAWVSRTWTDCLLAGVVDRALLRSNVVAALWEQIVADSKASRELMNYRAAAQLAMHAWQTVHAHRLSRRFADYEHTAETSAFHQWAQTFQERCAKQGWIDSSRALETIASRAADLPKPPKQLVAFGFDAFTPLQQELWSALALAEVAVTTLLPEVFEKHEHAGRIACADSLEEIRSAALWARRKLAAEPAARIGIAVPGLQELASTFESVFSEYLHPEHALVTHTHGERCFEISLGRKLRDIPLANTALKMLRLATSGLSAEDWSALLLSPYFGAGTSEASLRARLDFELRKKLRGTLTIARIKNLIAETNRGFAPKLYASLGDLERPARKLNQKLTRSEFATEVRRMLTAAGWPGDADGELTLSSEEFQASQAWDDLFAEFGALDQVLPARNGAELLRELEQAADETTFAEQNRGAQIQIAGPLALSGECFDALWFCGLSDEAWPPRSHPNPFLPHSLQLAARIPGCSAEVNLAEASRVTSRLLQSGDECVLSWPHRADERELRRSPLLNDFAERSPDPAESTAIRWNDLQAGAELEEFSDAVAPAITDADVAMRATNLLEWQSGCPFRAFAQARLTAAPLDEGSLGANARDRGRITELALQYVWDQLREWQSLESNSAAQIEEVIRTAIERALAEAFPIGDEEWMRQHREIERERLAALVREWLDVERKRGRFRDVQHQQPIEVSIGGITMNGRIDRLERTMDGAYVVIDYKTGGGKYSRHSWEAPRPEAPQLPIYAVAQRIKGHEIAGVAFAKVAAAGCELNGTARHQDILAKKASAKLDAEFAASLDSWQPELEGLAKNFLAGHAEVDPKHAPGTSKETCRFCHLGALCRIAEFAEIFEDDNEDEDDE